MIDQSQFYQFLASGIWKSSIYKLQSCLITWKITRSCIKNKYGFCAKNSTTQAILHFLQYLYKHIDSGNIVFSLFLDFCKAFDCVNHEILLSKLITCGVWGIALNWLRSYLTNREQYVCINNVDSNPRFIQCGVPQGSILGPLLFFIFINDIRECSNQFKNILFANDSTLSTCVPGDNVMDSAELINSELKCLDRWLKSNKISINGDKINCIKM